MARLVKYLIWAVVMKFGANWKAKNRAGRDASSFCSDLLQSISHVLTHRVEALPEILHMIPNILQ